MTAPCGSRTSPETVPRNWAQRAPDSRTASAIARAMRLRLSRMFHLTEAFESVLSYARSPRTGYNGSRAMPLSPGARLGPYEILDSIGAGGMGEVYRAKDTRLDRTVAIKILPAHLSSDPVS